MWSFFFPFQNAVSLDLKTGRKREGREQLGRIKEGLDGRPVDVNLYVLTKLLYIAPMRGSIWEVTSHSNHLEDVDPNLFIHPSGPIDSYRRRRRRDEKALNQVSAMCSLQRIRSISAMDEVMYL